MSRVLVLGRGAGDRHGAPLGGLPCQDAFAARVARAPCGSEVLVAALADGAGSAERADAGARLATSLSVEVAAEALADGAGKLEEAGRLLRFAAEQARLAIAALAGHEARSMADFASTLLLVMLHADGGVVAQIGDGAVVGERRATAALGASAVARPRRVCQHHALSDRRRRARPPARRGASGPLAQCVPVLRRA